MAGRSITSSVRPGQGPHRPHSCNDRCPCLRLYLQRGRSASSRKDAEGSQATAVKKRAPSAFLLFTKDARETLQAGLPFVEQQRALAAAWKALAEDSEERKAYVAKAAELKAAQESEGGVGEEGVKGKAGKAKKSGKPKGAGGKSLPSNGFQLFSSEQRGSLPPGLKLGEQAEDKSKIDARIKYFFTDIIL